MNILIIDDDPEDTFLFCEALSELHPGAGCIVAHTCQDINSLIERVKEVDIIFIDGHMYPIDGRTCLENLIQFVDRSKTKIVIHSSCLSPEDQMALQALGADYILSKAANFEMLKSNISEMLKGNFTPT